METEQLQLRFVSQFLVIGGYEEEGREPDVHQGLCL